jgi:hypothetical protein
MRTFTATTSAPPEAAWPLLARPDCWARWSPHVRGAWRLGAPEVRRGAVGAARLLGVVPVPARIVGKRAGRSWAWRVGFGLVEMVHRVEARPEGGATVAVDLIAPAPLERSLALAYGPLIELSLRRLAREAERG